MVTEESVLNSFLAIEVVDEFGHLIGEYCRESHNFVVLGELIEEVLRVWPKQLCFFGVAHNLEHIDDKRIPLVFLLGEVRVGRDRQKRYLPLQLAQMEKEGKIFENEIERLLNRKLCTVFDQLP